MKLLILASLFSWISKVLMLCIVKNSIASNLLSCDFIPEQNKRISIWLPNNLQTRLFKISFLINHFNNFEIIQFTKQIFKSFYPQFHGNFSTVVKKLQKFHFSIEKWRNFDIKEKSLNTKKILWKLIILLKLF